MKKCFFLFLIALQLFVSCKQSNFDHMCQKEAETQTKQMCPKKMTDGVYLDSVAYFMSEKTFTYYYSLDDSMYTEGSIMRGMDQVREKLREEIVNSVELKKYKDHDVNFKYIYYGKKSKKRLLLYRITPKDYRK